MRTELFSATSLAMYLEFGSQSSDVKEEWIKNNSTKGIISCLDTKGGSGGGGCGGGCRSKKHVACVVHVCYYAFVLYIPETQAL